jgi:hypothetical protein
MNHESGQGQAGIEAHVRAALGTADSERSVDWERGFAALRARWRESRAWAGVTTMPVTRHSFRERTDEEADRETDAEASAAAASARRLRAALQSQRIRAGKPHSDTRRMFVVQPHPVARGAEAPRLALVTESEVSALARGVAVRRLPSKSRGARQKDPTHLAQRAEAEGRNAPGSRRYAFRNCCPTVPARIHNNY